MENQTNCGTVTSNHECRSQSLNWLGVCEFRWINIWLQPQLSMALSFFHINSTVREWNKYFTELRIEFEFRQHRRWRIDCMRNGERKGQRDRRIFIQPMCSSFAPLHRLLFGSASVIDAKNERKKITEISVASIDDDDDVTGRRDEPHSHTHHKN